MIQIKQKEQCCGCTSCANACPQSAISMIPDEEGFLYPSVNEDLCVNCGLCDKVCPIINHKPHSEKTQGYIIRNTDDDIVKDSTSGGAFSLFAENLMKKGYIVYGTGYDDNMQVVCKAAKKPSDIEEMRGSKFVQSKLGSTFQVIKSTLKAGQKVLFIGTPCQVEGLVGFLGEKPQNLICIDFACRGVPSPGLWDNYLQMMEKKYGSKIVGVKFKNKTYGYHATTMKVDFANGKSWLGSGRVDPMMKAFVNELASRPSCHECSFKEIGRVSDITMFDCYQFTKITGLKDDDKGFSSILIHSEEGKMLFESIKHKALVYECNVQDIVSNNGIMINHSSKANRNRDKFYTLCSSLPIDQAMNEISPITHKDIMIEKAKRFLYRTGLIKWAKKLKKDELDVND